MLLNRNVTNKIRFILDQCLPPILRDSKWLMRILITILYRRGAVDFMAFKDKAPFMTDEEYREIYQRVRPYDIRRETDCNTGCVKEILSSIVGDVVLEVACGRGYLAHKIEETSGRHVIATDILISEEMRHRYPEIEFKEAFVERLPFPDKSIDTVVCTHCLEHVRNLSLCMAELRRVCRRRLIVVVPKQRPYKYTFDLHINFFPYLHSFLLAIHHDEGLGRASYVCKDIDGDIFYREDF